MIFLFKRIIHAIFKFKEKLDNDNITLYAAQSSFFIIMSAIPFIMLLVAMARLVVPFGSYTLTAAIEPYIPYNFIGIVEYIIKEVFDKTASLSVMSVSAVALVWSAPKGLLSLGMGICKIYEQNASGYIKERLVSTLYTVIFIIVLTAAITFMVLGRLFSALKTVTEGPIATFFILMLFFSVLYYVFSKRRIAYIKNLPGGAIAAAGWFIFSYLFAVYINRFANYSYMYGSIGALIGFMVWLYVCMNIILMGAEINVHLFIKLPERREQKEEQQNALE